MRLLITGSRTWIDEAAIELRLKRFANNCDNPILVSGHCPQGADAMCEAVAIRLGITLELHPANWKRYGRIAGFIRNEMMVSLGANGCYAFIRACSSGATHCANKALEAGIPTKVIRRI